MQKYDIENGVLTAYHGSDRELRIPQGVTVIGENAFARRRTVVSVELPEGLIEIRAHAFSGCRGLTSLIIPSTVETIDKNAFRMCTSVRELKVLTDKECSRDLSWLWFSSMQSIWVQNPYYVPESYRCMAVLTFSRDPGDPESERYGRHIAFIKRNMRIMLPLARQNRELMKLICDNRLIKAEGFEEFLSVVQAAGETENVARLVQYRREALTEEDFEKLEKRRERQDNRVLNRILARPQDGSLTGLRFAVDCSRDDRAGIKPYFRYGNKGFREALERCGAFLARQVSSNVDYLITDRTLQESVQRRKAEQLGVSVITPDEFRNLFGDRLFEIRDGVLCGWIGTGQTVTVTEPVTAVAQGAFEGDETVTRIDLPDTVTELGKSMLQNCASLESFRVPAGVKEIPDYAFRKCSALCKVTLPDGLTAIGAYAFSHTPIGQIDIPRTVDTIDPGAFSRSNLSEIDIPEGVANICTATFNSCSKLKKVTLPSTVKSIGTYAFADCASLERIDLPGGLESIGMRAFVGCVSLTEVRLPAGIQRVAATAFDECKGLKRLYVPEHLNTAGINVQEIVRY